MDLEPICIKILNISSKIENNNLSYGLAPLVNAGKRSSPAGPIREIASSFSPEVTKNITPDKTKVAKALKSLKRIANEYKITQLKKPIDDLSAFLSTLG